MNNLGAILTRLEQQDLHQILTHGMSEEVEKDVRNLCTAYQSATIERRTAIKAGIAGKSAWIALAFVSRMATLAMQQKNKDALDLGLVAFDLSNIMTLDPRDAFAPIGRLAFAAKECDVDLIERATAIISDMSPQLMQVIKNPKPPRVVRDDEGNLMFWGPWLTSKQRNVTEE
jgi:hypothetical protein